MRVKRVTQFPCIGEKARCKLLVSAFVSVTLDWKSMNYLKLAVVISCSLIACSDSLFASSDLVTLTFGQTSHDIGNQGPFEENGFQYQAFGESWALINTNLWQHGGDETALFTFFGIFPEVGNTMTFQKADNSPFLFESLDLRGRLQDQRNSVVIAHGIFNGVEVASQTLQSSNETWRVELANNSFQNPIDLLRLEVVEVNGAALILDNFSFAAVPEPNACELQAVGLSAGLWIRSRNAKRS